MRRRTVTVFTKPGCHLCEEAIGAIEAMLGGESMIDLGTVDIESSDELLAAYLERIPVVEVDGVEVSELLFDSEAFREAVGLTSGPSGQVA